MRFENTWYEWYSFWIPPTPGYPHFSVHGTSHSPLCQDILQGKLRGIKISAPPPWKPPQGSPKCKTFMEVWRKFGRLWHVRKWRGNGNNVVDQCDTLDLQDDATSRRKLVHVEKVTTTIQIVRDGVPPETLYLELLNPNPMNDPITDPECTMWHESYPHHCRKHHVVTWYDNGNGELDRYDGLDLHIVEGAGACSTYHYNTASVFTDIIAKPLPLPGRRLDNVANWVPGMGTPVGTYWQELSPIYDQHWTMVNWYDNTDGTLGTGDSALFINNSGLDTIQQYVEDVTSTIKVNWIGSPLDSLHYYEYMDDNPSVLPLTDILETFWHEPYPDSNAVYVVTDWLNLGQVYLDSSDIVTAEKLTQPDSGHVVQWVVRRPSTDLILSAGGPCDCRPGDASGNQFVDISDAVYLIQYIFAGGSEPIPYAVCSGDANCDCLVDISDAVFLIEYIFQGGAAPCDCQEWEPICGPPLW